jgi:hypothetical protein
MNSANTGKNGLEFLPHGPEFRFLDKVSSLTPGKEGAGASATNWCCWRN